MANVGRPSLRTPEVEERILDGLASGMSLRAICDGLGGAPSPVTVRAWVAADTKFRAAYARAREDGQHVHAESVVEIADEVKGGTADEINAARVRIDARKWLASKLAPRYYGDRIATEVSGPDGGPVEVRTLADLVKSVAARKVDPPSADGS